MASPSSATAGLWGNIYVLRPNGFKGSGLNDLTLGAASSVSDSFHLEILIDANGTPDTFKWRENGGEWTTGVAITGVSQNIVGTNGTQAITFAATTGHTVGDQWSIGNLYAEPTTESSNEAQITDTALRLLNPNAPPTWTDSGGETVLVQNYTNGWAQFTGNVSTVTVAGNNGYILESGLQQLGYVRGFAFTANCKTINCTPQGDAWDEFLADVGSWTGTIDKMFIANKDLFEILEDIIDGTQIYCLIQFFWYDPDQDQTGDHVNVWVLLTGENIIARKADLVAGNINFTVQGAPSFTAND